MVNHLDLVNEFPVFFPEEIIKKKQTKKNNPGQNRTAASPRWGLSDIVTKESRTFTWVGVIEPTQAQVLQPLPLWLIRKEQSGFRGSAPSTLPFALVTTWKGEHKWRENRESGPFRSTQPEAMKTAWFQRHTCMAKHGTGRYGRCWNKTHLMFLHVWERKQEHIFRVWPSFLSTRGQASS